MAEKIRTLTDNFATQDTTKWSFGAGASVTGGQLILPASTAYDSETYSVGRYDLTESSYTFEMPQAASGTGTGNADTYTVLFPGATTDNAVLWDFADNGATIRARHRVGFGNTDLYTATFGAAHRWLRIREAAGTVYWDSSPNGSTWTQRGSVAVAFDITTIKVLHGSGYGGDLTSLTPAIVDNVNTDTVAQPARPLWRGAATSRNRNRRIY